MITKIPLIKILTRSLSLVSVFGYHLLLQCLWSVDQTKIESRNLKKIEGRFLFNFGGTFPGE